jgi:putative ABC transport system permease protein
MGSILNDLRHALRLLQRKPAFAFAALLCLALGIGASTAVFSLLNGVLLRPMPFFEPDRLVFLGHRSEGGGLPWAPVSRGDITAWQERQSVLEGIAGYRNVTVTLQEGELPERLTGMGVTGGLFETLGVQAALGRTFTPEENVPGGPRVAVLTWDLWEGRFGGDPGIVGRAVSLQGEPHTVVGVMPPGFEFPWWSDIYLPLQLGVSGDGGEARNMRAVARLGEDVTLEQARTVLEGVQGALRAHDPGRYGDLGVYLNLYQDEERAYQRQGLVFLMVAVGLVLLIACVNVANILLARAAGRGREMAIRVSLGAPRRAVIRHLVAESLVLGGLGGAAGMLLGLLGRDLVLALAPMPQPFWMDFSVDVRVAGFVVATSLLTALLFGLAPAFFAARAHPAQLLRSGGDRTASGRKGWGLMLVAGEAALALGLLVSAGGMVKGFHSLLQVDPGFDPQGVLTFQVAFTRADYGEGEVRTALLNEAVAGLEGLPGVGSVGAVQSMPLSGDFWGQGYVVEGEVYPQGQRPPIGHIRVIHGEYFRTTGIPLVTGRTFTSEEIRLGSQDIVVNAELARRHWLGENPLGKQIKLGGPDSEGPWRTVVGVVGNVRQNGLDREEAQPGFYLPYANAPQYGMTFLLKTEGDPTLLTGPAREVLSRLAPSVPVFGVRTLREFYDHATGQTRFYTYLMGTFSLTALILTLLGVAGVMAFVVRSRMRDVGIRIALGAGPGAVLRRLLLEGMRPVVLGAALGIGLGYALLRGLAASFYGVEPLNPGLYLAQVALLMLTALVAVWLPSRSALKMDPARVLTEE